MGKQKLTYARAMRIANDFVQKFIKREYQIAGSLRRKEEVIGDIDIITNEFMNVLGSRFDRSIKLVSGGDKKIDVDFKGMRINIYYAENSYWGAMLFFLTGPAGYSIAYRRRAKERGWGLNQYGLFENGGLGRKIAGETEEGIYKAFDKNYKPPELRGK